LEQWIMTTEQTEQMFARLTAIDTEIKAYAAVLEHIGNDEDHRRIIEAHIDSLVDERARAMGLPEDEITRINQESEAAVETQIKNRDRSGAARAGQN
jgi:hypothetical protein